MDEREMMIWKMNLLLNGKNNLQFCKDKNIVGFGWGLKEPETNDYEEYKRITKLEAQYYADGKFNYALKCAMNGFEKMKPGHLIILLDENMKFYICIVLDDDKTVSREAEYYEANVTCNRKVKFLPKPFKKEDLQKMGVEPRHCIARHTIERMLTEDKKILENYIIETYSSYLS